MDGEGLKNLPNIRLDGSMRPETGRISLKPKNDSWSIYQKKKDWDIL